MGELKELADVFKSLPGFEEQVQVEESPVTNFGGIDQAAIDAFSAEAAADWVTLAEGIVDSEED
jgi:hypothetical protein